MINMYDMDETINETQKTRLLLDVKVETQLILQLLVKKGLVTKEEIEEMRKTVKNSPNYKPMYEVLDRIEDRANYYNDNPEQHLKDLFNAKLNEDIR